MESEVLLARSKKPAACHYHTSNNFGSHNYILFRFHFHIAITLTSRPSSWSICVRFSQQPCVHSSHRFSSLQRVRHVLPVCPRWLAHCNSIYLLLNILSIFIIFLLECNKQSFTPIKIFLKLLIKDAETLDSDLIGIKHSPNEFVRNVYVNALIFASFISI
jgi:hypothetical protein